MTQVHTQPADSEPEISALSPWFGNNRDKAEEPGKLMGPVAHCTVPFAGGMPELRHLRCREGVAGDLHRHQINLARVVRDPVLREQLIAELDSRLFHQDELADAQARCRAIEAKMPADMFGSPDPGASPAPNVQWAADYFVCCWMGKGGHSGKKTEFTQGLSVRMTSSGGSSPKRFRSAVEGLRAWGKLFERWSFVVRDGFELLNEVVDQADHGIYIDAPWPDAGEEYRHGFTVRDQEHLAERLTKFKHARIIVRFADHPLIRKLYPEGKGWKWHRFTSVNQKGNEYTEVLLERVR